MTDEVDDLAALRESTETGDRLEAVNQDGTSLGEEGLGSDEKQGTVDETATANPAAETNDKGDSGAATQNSRGSGGDVDEELVTALDEALDNLEGNDRALHIWDGNLAAVVSVLDSNPELRKQVVSELDAQMQADIDIDSQSEFLSYLLRVGLKEIAPETMDALRETRKQRALRKL